MSVKKVDLVIGVCLRTDVLRATACADLEPSGETLPVDPLRDLLEISSKDASG